MAMAWTKIVGGIAILGAWAYLGVYLWQHGNQFFSVLVVAMFVVGVALLVAQLRGSKAG